MHYRRTTLVVSILFLVGVIGLYFVTPKGFLPSEDTGQIVCFTEAAEEISFQSLVQHQRKLAEIVAQDPNVSGFMSNVGAVGSTVSSNIGRMFIRLKPRSERSLSADEVIQELRPKLATVPGIRVFMQNPPPINVGGLLTKSQYQYTLQSSDMNELYKHAPVLEAKLRELPGFLDVTSDLQIKSPQIYVRIDRDKASALGLSAGQVEDALYSAYSSRQISTIYGQTNQYWVIIELEPEYQLEPSALSLLYVRSSSGNLVPLSTVATLERTVGPLTVNHFGQIPAVTVSFNLALGKSLGDAVAGVEKTSRAVLPATITGSLINPQIYVRIDRDKASALGLSAVQVEDALYSAYSSRQISTIYGQTNQYWVIIELEPEYQMEPSALSLLYVRSSSGNLVPLSTVATLERTVGPLTVNHFGQIPAVTVSFNLALGKSLGDAVAGVEKTSREVLPATITGSLQGTAQAFKSSMAGLGILILVAILVIYIVLGILYESYIHPITILSGLPSAGLGALLTLLIFPH